LQPEHRPLELIPVTGCAVLPSPPARVWDALTNRDELARWFADIDQWEPGREFLCDFGDGDHFLGRVEAWERPRSLRLTWKFLGIGPESEVRFGLRPSGGGTELEVWHHGAASPQEADGLSKGWADFLSRLERYLYTGRPTRYDWTPEITAEALVGGAAGPILAILADPAWLSSDFPTASLRRLERVGDAIELEFADPAWRGRTTEAKATTRPVGDRRLIGVVHRGWTELSPSIRISERRRYARSWAAALRRLEQGWADAVPSSRA
jgi:uncharacterized protein YndB with AHSA1/START domain